MGSERVSYAPLAEVRDRMMQAESASRDEKDLLPLCISGKACQHRFCMSDLLDIDIQKFLDLPLIICDKCFRQIEFSYEIFARRIAGLRDDFFEQYLAVKSGYIESY